MTTETLKEPSGDPGCPFAKSLGRLNLTSALHHLRSQSTVVTGATNGCDPMAQHTQNFKTCSDGLTEMQQGTPKETRRTTPQHTFNPFCDVSTGRPVIDHPITTSVKRTAGMLSRGRNAPPILDPFLDVPVSLPPPLIPVPAPISHPTDSVERPQSGHAVLGSHTALQSPESGPALDKFWSTGSQISGSSDCLEVLRNFQEPAKPAKFSEQTVCSSGNVDSENLASECAVCWEKVPDCALYTCGHMCMCYECAINVQKKQGALCPICRQPIKDVIRIFKSWSLLNWD